MRRSTHSIVILNFWRLFLSRSILVLSIIGWQTGYPIAAAFSDSAAPNFKLCWQFSSDKATSLALSAQNNRVFFPSTDGEITALDVADGSVEWRASLGGGITAPPLVNQTSVFAASQTSAADEKKGSEQQLITVRALSAATGVTSWQVEFRQAEDVSLFLQNNILLVAVRQADGKQNLRALSSETGEARWSSDLTSAITTGFVFADSNVYFGTSDDSIVSLRLVDGSAGQKYKLRSQIAGQFAFIKGIFVFGDSAGSVTALRAADSRYLWTLRTGGAIQSIRETSRGVLISSLDNFIYLHSATSGKRRWRRRLSARPISADLLSSDSILLLATAESNGLIAGLKNGRIIGQIPLGAENYPVAPPVSLENRLVVSTLKGVLAFTDNSDCGTATVNSENKKSAD